MPGGDVTEAGARLEGLVADGVEVVAVGGLAGDEQLDAAIGTRHELEDATGPPEQWHALDQLALVVHDLQRAGAACERAAPGHRESAGEQPVDSLISPVPLELILLGRTW